MSKIYEEEAELGSDNEENDHIVKFLFLKKII